jgi:hypothetical protein
MHRKRDDGKRELGLEGKEMWDQRVWLVLEQTPPIPIHCYWVKGAYTSYKKALASLGKDYDEDRFVIQCWSIK